MSSCLTKMQARLAALKREEEWLHREQERLEAEKAQHIRQAAYVPCSQQQCCQHETAK